MLIPGRLTLGICELDKNHPVTTRIAVRLQRFVFLVHSRAPFGDIIERSFFLSSLVGGIGQIFYLGRGQSMGRGPNGSPI